MGKLIPAAQYVRMSSDKQETSPEQQQEAIDSLAKSHGYEIVARYEDLAVSGDATSKRHGFQRMVADGSTGKFSRILCWDQDRFGRFDLIEAGRWIEPLRSAGVGLHTVTGGVIDWTTLVGQLGYMAQQMGKAQYLRDLAVNVKRGQSRVEREGKWTRGFAPFGYVVDEESGKLSPASAEEVRHLRSMFEDYASGKSQREIAARLNALGVSTRRGNEWQSQSVRHTLGNIVYRGHLAYGKSTASKYLAHGSPDGTRKSRPEKDWQVVTNAHEALVSQELFDRCQARRSENRNMTGPKSKNRFSLTGLLYCGTCGSRLCGTTSSDKSKHYICIDYQNGKSNCRRRTVREDSVLPQVVTAIRTEFVDRYFGDAEREAIRDKMRELLSGNQQDAARERSKLQVRLAEAEAELEQATTALMKTSDDLRHLIEQRIRIIQDESDSLADRLDRADAPFGQQVEKVERRIDAVIGWLDRLEEVVSVEHDPVALSEMLRQFVDRVEVDIERVPNGRRVTNKLRGGRIFLRAESFPQWAIPASVELASPTRQTSC